MDEIWAIAGSTWRNVLRRKVIYFLIFCVWVLVGCALNYDILTLGLEKNLLVDVSLMLSTITAILTVVSVTFEIARELKNGEASNLLSKPLGRTHYLLGKMIGNMVVGFVLVALVALGSFVIFRMNYNDPLTRAMIQAQLLIMLSMAPMSALGVLFAILLPEIVAPVVTALIIWFGFSTGLLHSIPVLYGGILPDLDIFNLKGCSVYHIWIPWSYVFKTLVLGVLNAAFISSLASLIFSRKDIR